MKYEANPVIVDAWKIATVSDLRQDGSVRIELEGEGCLIKRANAEMLARFMPGVSDYWVVQEDGYEYLNPKAVFEHKYSLLDDPAVHHCHCEQVHKCPIMVHPDPVVHECLSNLVEAMSHYDVRTGAKSSVTMCSDHPDGEFQSRTLNDSPNAVPKVNRSTRLLRVLEKGSPMPTCDVIIRRDGSLVASAEDPFQTAENLALPILREQDIETAAVGLYRAE